MLDYGLITDSAVSPQVMAYLNGYPESQQPASPPDDGNLSVASWARSSQGPYYTNEDIAILHTIATAAQEAIDAAEEPKPLPVAALFQAYDRVLPENNIDPDSDHHLSALVFRVGGEEGHGSLPEKLQAILFRMDIQLEFDEDNGLSIGSSVSSEPQQPPPAQLLAPPPRQNNDPQNGIEDEYDRTPPASPPFKLPEFPRSDPAREDETLSPTRSGIEEALDSAKRIALSSALNRWRSAAFKSSQAYGKDTSKAAYSSVASRPAEPRHLPKPGHRRTHDENQRPLGIATSAFNVISRPDQSHNERPPAPLLRPSLLAAMGRWSSMAAQGKGRKPSQDGDQLSVVQEDTQELRSDQGSSAKSEPKLEMSQRVPTDSQVEVVTEYKLSGSRPATASASIRPSSMPVVVHGDLVTPQGQVMADMRVAQGAVAALQTQDERILSRAARAREIFLASKVFNHWADKTARRLEREAVAWRHMIRFRYFRGWCQGPTAMVPAANQLRVGTAAQKLRRAIKEHQIQLQFAAETAAQAYRHRQALRVLDRWSCGVVACKARENGLGRKKARSVKYWSSKARYERQLSRSVTAYRKGSEKMKILMKWTRQADQGATRRAAASQIGDIRTSCAHLRDWWDQAEVSRRAQAYRNYRLTSKAVHLFDQWNLRARAQAFVWRTEYLSVARVFDLWIRHSQHEMELETTAKRDFEKRAKAQAIRSWEGTDTRCTNLQRLRRRANLYIEGMRILDIFEKTVAQQKVEEKAAIRRYLRSRYQQVSSARKKRIFFSALDHWRTMAFSGQARASHANDFGQSLKSGRLATVIDQWYDKTADQEQRLANAQLHYIQNTLNTWANTSWDGQQRGTDAVIIWTSRKQHQSQKAWSLSSLQHRGLAHTASVVEEQHVREKRRKAFQFWRHRLDRGKNVTFEPFPQSESVFRSSHPFRASWRAAPFRRSQLQRAQDTPGFSATALETPTRWTGLPVPMSGTVAANLMPPLREAEEDMSAPSSVVEDEIVLSPSKRPTERSILANLPSTTPRGPVPAHLEQAFGATTPKVGSVRFLGPAKAGRGGSSSIKDFSQREPPPTGSQRAQQSHGTKRKASDMYQMQTNSNRVPSIRYNDTNTVKNLSSSLGVSALTMGNSSTTLVHPSALGSSNRPTAPRTVFRKSESNLAMQSTIAGSYMRR